MDFRKQKAVSFSRWRGVQTQLAAAEYHAVWHGLTQPNLIEVTWARGEFVRTNLTVRKPVAASSYPWQDKQLEERRTASPGAAKPSRIFKFF